jgi:uncharacterized protein (TIGR02231 family)
MKRIILSALALTISFQSFAQDEKAITANIKKVTVFLQGAQVTHEGSTTLSKGKQIVKLGDLSPYIQANSVTVKTKGVTLINVIHQINYVQEASAPKRLIALNDSIELVNDQLALANAKVQVLEEEKSMVLANKAIKGQEVLDIADLQEMAKFYRDHLSELAEKIQEGKIKTRETQNTLNRLVNEKNTLGYNHGKETGEILMEVYANGGAAAFEISYYTTNATWFPTYDIRAKDINSAVVLDYKANIQQNTGSDWKDVELTLSTGNPSVSGQAPTIEKWNISFYRESLRKLNEKMMKSKARLNAPSFDADGASEVQSLPGVSAGKYANAAPIANYQEATTTTQYIISTPYSILSNSKNHKVDIAQHEVAATYQYKAVPKIDPTAFLVAQITNWEKFNLLAGEANIFFEDAFVGNSFIDPATANDTMDISLGRDKNIVISRTKVGEESKKMILGSDKSVEYTWEIKVKNNKAKAVTIEIKDQIPVSTNGDIEVSSEVKEGILDKETGIITNEFTVNPSEEKVFRFTYKVKYPKKYNVILE